MPEKKNCHSFLMRSLKFPASRVLSVPACLALAMLLPACAAVKVGTLKSDSYMLQRRSDVISSHRLSSESSASLFVLGLDSAECMKDSARCAGSVASAGGLDEARQYSALSEIWLSRGMELEKQAKTRLADAESKDERDAIRASLRAEALDAYFRAARYAYCDLFHSGRDIGTRAFEDRHNQVRDFYNFASQQAVALFYEFTDERNIGSEQTDRGVGTSGWTIRTDLGGVSLSEKERRSVTGLQADTLLTFKGIRNQYVSDGIGARMVVTLAAREKADGQPWEAMSYVPVNTLLTFPGADSREILAGKTVVIEAHDADREHSIRLGNVTAPLAANHSAAYGLWLANSDFSSQSIKSIFGQGSVFDSPRVFLMQPYRPELKTVILVHGLASSPEAWVNAANEIMGDEKLRSRYQIWQVYYPTVSPLLVNRHDIAEALTATLDHYDPQRKNPASSDIVIIGHSMGGILSRLLVSSSGKGSEEAIFRALEIPEKKWGKADETIGEYTEFTPFKGITRAVFLAAPHRGTPFADITAAKILASFVKLPFTLVKGMNDAFLSLLSDNSAAKLRREASGVHNLSARNPVVLELARLPISAGVTFHTVVGNNTPGKPLAESSDGIVPYSSSHLEGAASELAVPSGHSVQETPAAILEIRRILHEHLRSLQGGS